MSKKAVLFFILAAAVILGIGYVYKEYTRTNKSLTNIKADYKLKVNELITAFETNEQQANQQYLDKIIAVSGTIKEIYKDDDGNYSVILGEQESMSSVRCAMDSTQHKVAARLLMGSEVTIKGACTGFNADDLLGSDVILNRCVIEKKN